MTDPRNHEAVVVSNPLPSAVVIIDSAAMAKIHALSERASKAADIAAGNPDGLWSDRKHFDAAADLYSQIRTIEKVVEDNRKALKAPVLDYGRKIDAAAKGAIEPLQSARDMLGAPLARYQKHLDDLAEQARIEQERAKLAEMEAARQRRQAEADAAMADLVGDTLPEMPVAEPEPAPMIEAPAPATKVVRMHTAYTLEIVDAAQIPREYLVPDESAIKRAMRDGADVPGCVLHVESKPVATGR